MYRSGAVQREDNTGVAVGMSVDASILRDNLGFFLSCIPNSAVEDPERLPRVLNSEFFFVWHQFEWNSRNSGTIVDGPYSQVARIENEANPPVKSGCSG